MTDGHTPRKGGGYASPPVSASNLNLPPRSATSEERIVILGDDILQPLVDLMFAAERSPRKRDHVSMTLSFVASRVDAALRTVARGDFGEIIPSEAVERASNCIRMDHDGFEARESQLLGEIIELRKNSCTCDAWLRPWERKLLREMAAEAERYEKADIGATCLDPEAYAQAYNQGYADAEKHNRGEFDD